MGKWHMDLTYAFPHLPGFNMRPRKNRRQLEDEAWSWSHSGQSSCTLELVGISVRRVYFFIKPIGEEMGLSKRNLKLLRAKNDNVQVAWHGKPLGKPRHSNVASFIILSDFWAHLKKTTPETAAEACMTWTWGRTWTVHISDMAS